MPHWRRYYIPNALIFITTVTCDRRPILGNDRNVQLLFDTMTAVQIIHPFHLLAYVILPDHVHFLMRTDPPTTFSQAMQSIKGNYTVEYKKANGITSSLTLWQHRFWDHVIRDELDLARHMDYIHYNPVKHKCASSPSQWQYSTFAFWAERGYYDPTWGSDMPTNIAHMEME